MQGSGAEDRYQPKIVSSWGESDVSEFQRWTERIPFSSPARTRFWSRSSLPPKRSSEYDFAVDDLVGGHKKMEIYHIVPNGLYYNTARREVFQTGRRGAGFIRAVVPTGRRGAV
eukprot:scaffold20880_cov174-Amphora_coffeaeformis.AAC.1